MAIKPSLAKYVPEDIPGASVVDLVSGTPYSVESISRFSKIPGEYLVTLLSFGLLASANVIFYTNPDGTNRVIDSETYSCYHLDEDEDVFVSARSSMHLKLLSDAGVSDYPIRYLIRVSKPSVLEKLLYGIPLSDADIPLNNMFNLSERVLRNDLPVHKPMLVSRRQIARKITASGGDNPQVGETITVPKNRYVVLDEIAVDGYESGVTDNFIVVNRDIDDEYVKLNCFAMPPFVYNTTPGDLTPDIPLSYSMKIGIPAVDKLSVYLENGSGVTNWRARFKYSMYVLTVPDKLRWGIALTPEEETIAEENNLRLKVKAGLA